MNIINNTESHYPYLSSICTNMSGNRGVAGRNYILFIYFFKNAFALNDFSNIQIFRQKNNKTYNNL